MVKRESSSQIPLSRVVAIESFETRSGLVLDGLDQIKEALEKFAGKNAQTSAVYESLKMRMPNRYKADINFYHDGSMFKTFLCAEKVGDKYVLSMVDTYLGDAKEERLSKELKVPRALNRVRLAVKMSVDDRRQYNISLCDLLGGAGIPKNTVQKAVGNSWENGETIDIIVIDGEQPVKAKIGFTLHPSEVSDYCLRGTALEGEQPTVYISLGYLVPGRMSFQPVVDVEQINRLNEIMGTFKNQICPESNGQTTP